MIDGYNFSYEDLVDNIHDKKWRMSHLYFIRTKQGKKVLFDMNNTQKELNKSKSNFNMTLKGRQQGVSTYYILKYFDDCIWSKHVNVVILSHNRESLGKLFRIVKFAYLNLPEQLRPLLSKGGGSKHEYFFPDINSRISVTLEVRSESVSHLHVSEYGLMQNKQRFNASIESVPIDGSISIESTPFGINHFHDDWIDPNFPYKKHFFPWYFHYENVIEDHSIKKSSYTDKELELIEKAKKLSNIKITEKQIAWRRFKIGQKSLKSFQEEHPEDDVTCFLVSGNSVMDLQMLAEKKALCPNPIEDNGDLKIWENYQDGEDYVIGADTAEGVGSDYSVAVVYKKKSRVQVAQLRGHIKPKKFAEGIFALAEKYIGSNLEYPLLAVERNNHGHAVLLWLEEQLEYDNLFEHTDGRIGWLTNRVTRPIMVDTLIDAIDSDMVDIKDEVTYGECMTLIDNNGKIEAMSGKHDDAFMAHSITLQMCIEEVNYLDKLLKD